MRLAVLSTLVVACTLAKRTYRLEQTPVLKAPRVQKYDCRNCIYDDTLNYICLEHSIDVKVGWDIRQRWELALDVDPPRPAIVVDNDQSYEPATSFPDTRYKYTWKIIPYVVFNFNVRPNVKIDRIFQVETQLNVDQFKSAFYLAFVYYQRAVKYSWAGVTLPTGIATGITDSSVTEMKNQYTLFTKPYNGKMCLDIGYNLEDILITWKSAMSYRDCYKNLLYTFADYSNWFGPKAMWVDNCEFHSDEDFLMYSYNPFNLAKDTGDISMLHHESHIRSRTPGVKFRRPAHGHSNFYRDCLPIEDDFLLDIAGKL